MAEITSELRTFLLNNTVISSAFGTGIHVNKVPDETAYPYGLIKRVYENSIHTQDGRFGYEAMAQIEVYDEALSDCITNANLIFNLLDGYKGVMGSTEVGSVFMGNKRDEWAPDSRHYRCLMEAEIKWTDYG